MWYAPWAKIIIFNFLFTAAHNNKNNNNTKTFRPHDISTKNSHHIIKCSFMQPLVECLCNCQRNISAPAMPHTIQRDFQLVLMNHPNHKLLSFACSTLGDSNCNASSLF